LEAIATAGLTPSASHSRPNALVGIDGKTYWAKGNVQQGLVAELIAGRLAAHVGAGPAAQIIRVTPEILPGDGSCNHLLGVVVGSADQHGMVNARDLAPLLAGGTFDPGAIDPSYRARVVAFHTWLGVGDAQVLVSMTDGKVMSIDHGECFGNVPDPADAPGVITVDIPGVDVNVGRESKHVLPAVDRIEAVPEEDILRAVACIPAGAEWRSPSDRRLAIGRWLCQRKGMLRGVMTAWMTP